jgi:hypothetical protein
MSCGESEDYIQKITFRELNVTKERKTAKFEAHFQLKRP